MGDKSKKKRKKKKKKAEKKTIFPISPGPLLRNDNNK